MKKSDIYTNPRLYVPLWFERTKRGNEIDPFIFDTLWLDYKEDFANLSSKKHKPIGEKDMFKAFSEFSREIPKTRLKVLENGLKCPQENLSQLEVWLMAVASKVRIADLAIMAHWVWMVKRKIKGLPVKWQVMPVVVSRIQGNGKSTAIRSLMAPIKDFQYNMQMNKLADESVYASLAANLIVFFDELEGIQKTDLNTLKNQITTDANSYRPLYRQERVTVPMRCSFIGASNKPLDESFFDSSGMRRFYGIKAANEIDWEAINTINYTALWQGIDENREHGYLVEDSLKAVQLVQAGYVNNEDIDEYLYEFSIIVATTEHKTIQAKDLYDNYRQWAVKTGVKYPLSYISFHKKLINRGVSFFEKRNDKRSRIRYYKVNVDCSLPELMHTEIEATVLEFKS